MRIAMVSEHASPVAPLGGEDAGGQNVHVAGLSRQLAELGHDVTVYTRRDDVALPERMRHNGYEVVHVPAGPPRVLPKDVLAQYMPAFGRWLCDDWQAQRPDVVHAHFWMSGVAARQACAALPATFVMTYHALGIVKRRHQGAADTSPVERLAVERALGRQAHAVVATAQQEADELSRLGVPRARIHVVPCGVDLDHFSPSGPAASRGARPRVLVVSRLVPRKGVDTVIAALAGVPHAELVIAGGPPRAELDTDPEVRRLREVAHRAGVQDRLVWLGRVDRPELPALYRSADVVVCTPHYEPFGIVPLEAMACGRPVVASDVGGLRDSVVDGVTGHLVPPRRPEVLAGAVRRLLHDSFEADAMGVAGADRASGMFGWPSIASRTAFVYERVVGPRVATAEAAGR